MKKHLIFYDGECPLCNRVVRFVLAADKKKQFLFAPLQGITAEKELHDFKRLDLDTLVLLENYQTSEQQSLIEGKGALRIFWHLGGIYTLLGCLSFFPSFLFDRFYRFVARRRYRLFKTKKTFQDDSGRFLD